MNPILKCWGDMSKRNDGMRITIRCVGWLGFLILFSMSCVATRARGIDLALAVGFPLLVACLYWSVFANVWTPKRRHVEFLRLHLDIWDW